MTSAAITDCTSALPFPDNGRCPAAFGVVALEGIDGAGKTSLAGRIADALGGPSRVHVTRLSAHMGGVLRELFENSAEGQAGGLRYNDVIPGDLRRATYIVDAVVQFRYLHDFYAAHDLVVVDRWLQTYAAYCGPLPEHAKWYERLEDEVHCPDLLVHLRVSPEVAFDRLHSRGDWTAEHWSRRKLLDDLRRLAERYDELMEGTGCVTVNADAEADVVTTEVLAAIRANAVLAVDR